MRMPKPKGQSGVTLVELLLVIVVIGFVMAAAASFLSFGTRTFSISSSQAKVQQEARLATTMVSQDLRTAIEVALYTAGTKPTPAADQYMVERLGATPPYALQFTRPGVGIQTTDYVFTNLTFGVTTGPNSRKFVTMNATGTDRGRQYTIDSSMLLENDFSALADTTDMTVIIFRR